MQYKVKIPETIITLTAKDKKQALKEARKVLDALLRKPEYWTETNT